MKDNDFYISSDDSITIDASATDVGTIDLGNYSDSINSTYTISGSGYTFDTMNYNIGPLTTSQTVTWAGGTTSITNPAVMIDNDGINVKEGGDIKIGGKSLMDAIEKIEDRLAILKPNPKLEDKWEQLKDLRRQYEALEKDILEKEKIMKILKET